MRDLGSAGHDISVEAVLSGRREARAGTGRALAAIEAVARAVVGEAGAICRARTEDRLQLPAELERDFAAIWSAPSAIGETKRSRGSSGTKQSRSAPAGSRPIPRSAGGTRDPLAQDAARFLRQETSARWPVTPPQGRTEWPAPTAVATSGSGAFRAFPSPPAKGQADDQADDQPDDKARPVLSPRSKWRTGSHPCGRLPGAVGGGGGGGLVVPPLSMIGSRSLKLFT